MSRLEKSAKNILLSFGNTAFSSVLTFVSRTIFIMVLGKDYLGLSGLLTNILGFLSLTELGISSAIGFSLYKPLAEKDSKTISSLMSLYRRAYIIIAFIVAVSGIILYFSLDFFIPVSQQPAGIDFAYFVFLINIVISYLLSYKVTLISSDNQAYQLVPINVIVMLIQTIGQIIVLIVFKSYVVYLAVQIICSIILMLIQNRYITKKYREIDFYSTEKIDKIIYATGVDTLIYVIVETVNYFLKKDIKDVDITFEEDYNNSYVKILNSTTYTKDFIKTIVLILSGNSDVGIDIKDGKITLSVPKPSND